MKERITSSYGKTRVGMLILACLCVLGAQAADAGWFGRSKKKSNSFNSNGFLPEMAGCYRQRVAVCIGINRYESHPKLDHAENDAAEMAAIFREFGFDEVVLLTGKEAVRRQILDTLDDVRKTVREDDLVVLYFAGHGVTVRKGETGLMGYLLPADCRSGREGEDGLSMTILKEMTDTMPSRHSLLLVDACYSGYGLGNTAANVKPTGGFEADTPCLQIITAGGELDRAFEREGHGLFTGHLLNSLNEIARAGEGWISGRQLAALVTKRVIADTGGWQAPQFGLEGSGDIALVKRRAKFPNVVAMAD
jgi:uncharacterized caspase-like protein